jgi:hypothetical protein
MKRCDEDATMTDPNEFHPLLHDRGRGPELRGTRITVYQVWDELLDPNVTEHELCLRYSILPHELAVLRAFALRNFAEIAEKIRGMDERTEQAIAAQDTPDFRRRNAESRQRLREMFVWLQEGKADPSLFPEIPGESDAERRDRKLRLFEDWRRMRNISVAEAV